MAEIDIRKVSEMQIYDSYMGILRISPNAIGSGLADDPTTLLESPVDFTKTTSERTKIIISDSDGNPLPHILIPNVRTLVVKNNEGANVFANIIEISHHLKQLFVTDSLNVRSTLSVGVNMSDDGLPLNERGDNTAALVTVVGQDALIYPNDSPRDGDYFNADNIKQLVPDTTPMDKRAEVLDAALFNKSKGWYTDLAEEHKVKVNGKLALRPNKDNEEVPILYTHDYALGHQHNHHLKYALQVGMKWFGNDNQAAKVLTTASNVTKMSFVRIDDLVWKMLGRVLTGDIRDIKAGRFTGLGKDGNINIDRALLGADGYDAGRGNQSIDTTHDLAKTLPLMGAGYEAGLVGYNAINFKRYLFYVARQILHNAKEGATSVNTLHPELSTAEAAKKITPFAALDDSPFVSITKNFVLCNGDNVTFANFPNLNLLNDNLFEQASGSVGAKIVNGSPVQIATKQNTVYTALRLTTNTETILTPALFEFDTKAPRFIRGLNWNVERHAAPTNIQQLPTNLYSESNLANKNPLEIICDKPSYNLPHKNIETVGVYKANYDFRIAKDKHRHYAFSSQSGQSSVGGEISSNNLGTIKPNLTFALNRNYTGIDTGTPATTAQQLIQYSTVSGTYKLEQYEFNKVYQSMTPVKNVGLFILNGLYYNNSTTAKNILKAGYILNDNKERITLPTTTNASVTLVVKLNEAEGRAPIAAEGGSSAHTYGITFTYVEKHHREKKGHHKRRRTYKYHTGAGGYKLVSWNDEMAGKGARCLTSLPFTETHSLGANKEETEAIYKSFGTNNVTIKVDMTLPTPPALSLLPLMRI